MPNHCENDLYLRGSAEDKAAVLAFIGMADNPPTFDFSRVLPYPERWAQMDADRKAIEDAGSAAGLAAIGGAWPAWDNPEFKAARDVFNDASIAVQQPLADAYLAKWGTRQDGYNSGGYEWCCRVWGTKWGAYRVARRDYDGDTIITYQTAWSPSRSIIIELAKRFPTVTFYLEYFERGMSLAGGFCCPSEEDWYSDDSGDTWTAGIVTDEWEMRGYKGSRGG